MVNPDLAAQFAIDEVARLKVRCILTDREAESARKRIMAIIKKQVKPL